jgi:predicted nucleotidyltransferase
MYGQAQIDEVVGRIVSGYAPERVILFGSYARGTARDDSDVDLLLVKQTSTPRIKRSAEVLKHIRGMTIPVDVVVYTRDELREWANVGTSFAATVLREGRVLYGSR